MEAGPRRPSPIWFWGPNSIIVVYMDPLGIYFGFKFNPDKQWVSFSRSTDEKQSGRQASLPQDFFS